MVDTNKIDSFSNKKITVFGANRSGTAIARLLNSVGAEIVLTDTRDSKELSNEISQLEGLSIQFQLGGHDEKCIDKTELIVVSPGVPLDISILVAAKKKNIPIYGELEISSLFCPAPIVAITGTKGKSTTTLLTAAILKESGLFEDVVIAGNIGIPLASIVASMNSQDIVVVEASSFQLESTHTFKPKVSVVLNISRDHLDRHGTMETYVKSKTKICLNQINSDWIVLNYNDPIVMDFADSTSAKKTYFNDKLSANDEEARTFWGKVNCLIGARLKRINNNIGIFAYKNGQEHWICDVSHLPLPGTHNISNSLAATVIGTIFNVAHADIGKAIINFNRGHPALEHAFEKVRVINGVDYINDSKATNVIATYAALESIEKSSSQENICKNILLIIGGYDKGNDYEPLYDLVNTKVKKLILLGEHTQNIQKTFLGSTEMFHTLSMVEAVEYAYEHASTGDTVLLSPANASFDMFTDYKSRGEAFKNAVNSLKL